MRVIWLVPVCPLLLLLAVGLSDGGGYADPEKMNPVSASDYQHQAQAYADRGQKQEALAACEAIVEKGGASPSQLCLLEVYEALNDLDGQIEVNEEILTRQLTANDIAAPTLTKKRLEQLKEKKERRENSKFKWLIPLLDKLPQ